MRGDEPRARRPSSRRRLPVETVVRQSRCRIGSSSAPPTASTMRTPRRARSAKAPRHRRRRDQGQRRTAASCASIDVRSTGSLVSVRASGLHTSTRHLACPPCRRHATPRDTLPPSAGPSSPRRRPTAPERVGSPTRLPTSRVACSVTAVRTGSVASASSEYRVGLVFRVGAYGVATPAAASTPTAASQRLLDARSPREGSGGRHPDPRATLPFAGERPPRLLRQRCERSLTDQVVRRFDSDRGGGYDAACHELFDCTLGALVTTSASLRSRFAGEVARRQRCGRASPWRPCSPSQARRHQPVDLGAASRFAQASARRELHPSAPRSRPHRVRPCLVPGLSRAHSLLPGRGPFSRTEVLSAESACTSERQRQSR